MAQTGLARFLTVSGALFVAMLGTAAPARADLASDNWAQYAAKFVMADGRVIDPAAKSMSHSESEGTAMLLAERANDRARFDKIWGWTRINLGGRKDGLFTWGWHPETRNHKPDKNNATDGDTLIAWALAEAADRWNDPAYKRDAIVTAKGLIAHMLRETPAGPVLLPGTVGFETKKGMVINFSYLILPAYPVLDKVYPNPAWKRLTDTTRALEVLARRGRFSLPTDWTFLPKVGKNDKMVLEPWADKPGRFGYDAIRIPLYLAWIGADGRDLWPFLQFWSYFDKLPFHPAWFDVVQDSVTLSDMPSGFVAVRRLAEQAQKPDAEALKMPTIDAEKDYYSASLIALSTLALNDRAAKK